MESIPPAPSEALSPPAVAVTKALPPTWTPAPTQTVTATATRRPTFTPILSDTPPAPVTPTADAILTSLPPGALPLRYNGWRVPFSWGGDTRSALPYQMPDGSLGIALVDDYQSGTTVYWHWHAEPLAQQYRWQAMHRLGRFDDRDYLPFVAQDQTGNWWLGAVTVFQDGSAAFLGMIPVHDSEEVYLRIVNDAGDTGREFWLLEQGTLFLYHWVDHAPQPIWRLPDAPKDAVVPRIGPETDVTGDGNPELCLNWWTWQKGLNWQQVVERVEYYQRTPEGYRKIAEMEGFWQHTDLNGDGSQEFLLPQPTDTPTSWAVYQWNGEKYEWASPLPQPTAVFPETLHSKALPPLPTDLYFSLGGVAQKWPRQGGELQAAEAIPPSGEPRCGDAVAGYTVELWSPDCRYAVVGPAAAAESSPLSLWHASTQSILEIPHARLDGAGQSTFAWDTHGRWAFHARAGEHGGLYRMNLEDGATQILLDLSGLGAAPFGAAFPFAFPDGSVGFSVQGSDRRLYPPWGVYRLYPDGTLQRLAEIPSLTTTFEDEPALWGQLLWSPDGRAFLYTAPLGKVQGPPYKALLLGLADGSAVWDLNPLYGKAQDFRWGK